MGCGDGTDSSSGKHGKCGTPPSVEEGEENERKDAKSKGPLFASNLLEKLKTDMNLDVLDDETTKMVQILVILKLSTKNINLWARQLEMKRKEKRELDGLMKFESIMREIGPYCKKVHLFRKYEFRLQIGDFGLKLRLSQ